MDKITQADHEAQQEIWQAVRALDEALTHMDKAFNVLDDLGLTSQERRTYGLEDMYFVLKWKRAQIDLIAARLVKQLPRA